MNKTMAADLHGGTTSAMRTSREVASSMPLSLRLRRVATRLAWRYRYLIGFIAIGFVSIALEVVLVLFLLPASWPSLKRSLLAFVIGMIFAFAMNAKFNFHVSRRYFYRTFLLFALISALSYSLNVYAATYLKYLAWNSYPLSRFASSGCLFLIAYYLHRRFTFRNVPRSLGLAMYTSEIGEISQSHWRVCEQCDHIHIDLVDETFDPEALPTDIDRIKEVRELYRWHPLCLHLMSKRPRKWIDELAELSDWILIHVDIDEDVMENIAACRQHDCKVGVVWHHTVAMEQVLPYLPHVDFLMVLGIDRPGRSGQTVLNSALEASRRFRRLAHLYRYEVIFDGGVTIDNISLIPASIVVSSSTVLRAQNPIHNALVLMSGGSLHGR